MYTPIPVFLKLQFDPYYHVKEAIFELQYLINLWLESLIFFIKCCTRPSLSMKFYDRFLKGYSVGAHLKCVSTRTCFEFVYFYVRFFSLAKQLELFLQNIFSRICGIRHGYDITCPHQSHRTMRATAVCYNNSITRYQCLYNIRGESYVESCRNIIDYEKPGK